MADETEPRQEQGESESATSGSQPPPAQPPADAAETQEPKPAAADPAEPKDESGAASATVARPGVEEVVTWSGQKLDEMNGASVGRIDGAYVDEDGGGPEWLQVRLGRFGHHTLVPARDAVAGAGHVWVPFTRDVIRRAPRVKSGTPLAKEQELALLGHYGIGGETGRAAEIADRPANAVTARPAS